MTGMNGLQSIAEHMTATPLISEFPCSTPSISTSPSPPAPNPSNSTSLMHPQITFLASPSQNPVLIPLISQFGVGFYSAYLIAECANYLQEDWLEYLTEKKIKVILHNVWRLRTRRKKMLTPTLMLKNTEVENEDNNSKDKTTMKIKGG
ncbi:hypothetical protein BT96DRAFT_938260 [Gymnopus androsaceus JB14]|uniref:Uncharacterized protein n=1 Tax=Gymnopus androsaceus JB14 TaxID=1447944 RepID=A0A6A4HVL6_9AGAR|nr:hypothetical protein BT96DRAFT_938260 [Gymnopus androsaceus JB14]